MTVLDFPMDARLGRIEERLGSVERDVTVIKTMLKGLDKRMVSPWFIVSLVLPLYAVFIVGFASMIYFLLNFVKPSG